MGKLGNGYGSEYHLHYYLDHHRDVLNEKVREKIVADQVEWLPGPPSPKDLGKFVEWKGLQFLADDAPLQGAWSPTGMRWAGSSKMAPGNGCWSKPRPILESLHPRVRP